MTDPETRQFRVEDLESESGDGEPDSSSDSTELSVDDSSADDSSKRRPPDKKAKPGKLPASVKKAMTDNSRDAADNALKRFFSGR